MSTTNTAIATNDTLADTAPATRDNVQAVVWDELVKAWPALAQYRPVSGGIATVFRGLGNIGCMVFECGPMSEVNIFLCLHHIDTIDGFGTAQIKGVHATVKTVRRDTRRLIAGIKKAINSKLLN